MNLLADNSERGTSQGPGAKAQATARDGWQRRPPRATVRTLAAKNRNCCDQMDYPQGLGPLCSRAPKTSRLLQIEVSAGPIQSGEDTSTGARCSVDAVARPRSARRVEALWVSRLPCGGPSGTESLCTGSGLC